MTFPKITSFTKKVTDLPNTPSPTFTAEEIKEYMQTPAEELKETFNQFIDELIAPSATEKLNTVLKDGTTTSVKDALNNIKGDRIVDKEITRAKLSDELTQQPSDTIGIQAKFVDVDTQLADIAINVKSFGAKGNFNPNDNSGNDDTQAFKDAIAYADANKTNVYVPRGNYKITSTLNIPTGIVLYGEGGWSRRTIISQVGDFNCFEMISGYSGGSLKGILITGLNNNGLNNTAIYVKRSSVILSDINIESYKGTGINMDGSVPDGTGSWFAKLDRIKIVGCIVNGVYFTNKGLVLGDNFNSSFVTNFTVHYCKVGIESKTVNNISVSKGNLSENKDTNSFAVKMTEAGTNVKFSDIHFEGNTNGIQILKGNLIVLDNLISNGYSIQQSFIDIPSGSIAQNIYIQNCRSFGSMVADVRVDNYKTYILNIVNCSLTSGTPILNLNNSEIAITSFGVTTKDANSLQPLQIDKTLVITGDTTLGKNQTNITVLGNSGGVINLTLPPYTQGLRYTIINTRTSGVIKLPAVSYQCFGAETGLISNAIQLYSFGFIELFSSGDRWIILNQKGDWTKI